jgi:nitrogenase molybdenum-iron protein beta chain
MEPSDMREIKRIAGVMETRTILFPDMSGVLDAPLTGKFEMYPAGGTTIPEMIATGDSKFSIGLGAYSTEDACVKLENKCKVKFEVVEIPIGLKATDRFIISLSRHANVPVPDSLTEERGRLIDLIADNSKCFYGKRVALFGDPDTLIPLTEFLLTLDMKPVYIVTGTPGKHFDDSMAELLSEKVPEAKYKSGERADMFQLHQWIKQEPVDLLIGNTYGKYIARDENLPFVRLGFPITDRPGHNYFPHVGYAGATNLAIQILEKTLDHQDRTCPESKVEFQM